MKRQKIVLLLGAGYTARALLPSLKAQNYHVIATTRTKANTQKLKNLGAEVILYKSVYSDELISALEKCDILLSSIPPNRSGDLFLNHLPKPIKDLIGNLSWAGYLSATSVYGDRQGQWTYEDEFLKPQTQRGKNRANAELQWLETGLPIHIFRLAGIYGPKRSNFERLRQGKARAVIKLNHVVNRIHVDDISKAILKSINHPQPVSIYNLADGHPAPPQDVINFAADLINFPRPPALEHESADISDMARSFYTETKRISCDKALRELNWKPQYSNYRQGLMATLKEERGEKETVWLSGWLEVPHENLANIKRTLSTHIRLTHQEPDCNVFRVWQDEINPLKFHVIESFQSPQAFYRHQARLKNSEWALVSHNAVRHYDIIGL